MKQKDYIIPYNRNLELIEHEYIRFNGSFLFLKDLHIGSKSAEGFELTRDLNPENLAKVKAMVIDWIEESRKNYLDEQEKEKQDYNNRISKYLNKL